jgi:hypothetical protein
VPAQPEINRLTRFIRRAVHPDTTAIDQLNIQALQNAQGTGILQKTLPVEREISARTGAALARWRKNGVNLEEMRALQDWAVRRAVQILEEVAGLVKSQNTKE